VNQSAFPAAVSVPCLVICMAPLLVDFTGAEATVGAA
jgi:hypothetical protein